MGVFVSVCSFRVISQHLNLFLFFLFLENMGCCYSCLPLASWTHELEVRVAQQFGNIGVIEREILSVNLRYLRSNGSRQLLGNGALVLTSDLLWFNYLRPANVCSQFTFKTYAQLMLAGSLQVASQRLGCHLNR